MTETNDSQPSRRRSALWALAAVVLLGAAGCGGSSQGTSSAGTPGTKAGSATTAATQAGGGAPGKGKVMIPSNFCSLLSASEISQVVGQSMPTPQLSASGGGERDCDSNAPGTNVGLVSFSLFVESACYEGQAPSASCLAETSQTFDTDKQYDQQHYGSLQPVSGLGEQAYCSIDNTPNAQSATVHVLQGWLRISVYSDTCAHSETLAGMLLPRI